MLELVDSSGGVVCDSSRVGSLITLPGLDDREDERRFTEATRTMSEIFLTRDGPLRDAAAGMRPLVLTPRVFVDRARSGRQLTFP